MELQGSIREELVGVQPQKRRIEAASKTRRPDSLQETAAVSSSEIDRLIQEDPAIRAMAANLYEMEQRLELESGRSWKVTRKPGMEPIIEHLRDDVDTLKKTVEKKRELVRAEVKTAA